MLVILENDSNNSDWESDGDDLYVNKFTVDECKIGIDENTESGVDSDGDKFYTDSSKVGSDYYKDDLLDSLLDEVMAPLTPSPSPETDNSDKRSVDTVEQTEKETAAASEDYGFEANSCPEERLLSFEKKTFEEERSVSETEVPDFISNRNVYGTSFDVLTGAIFRPSKIDYLKKNHDYIQVSRVLSENKLPSKLSWISQNHQTATPIKYGSKLEILSKRTGVYVKNATESAKLETSDVQRIIKDAFNSRRFAVLLLGVEFDHVVTGYEMTSEERDNLRLAIDTAVQTEFVPPIENVLGTVEIVFAPVVDAPNDNTFVTIIRVVQIRNQNYSITSGSKKSI